MKLKTARIQNYRSIRDTGEFDVETAKTILVGPNEAGKTAILRALQQINAPTGVKGFDPLRDYPRALLSQISTHNVESKTIPVVTVTFELDERDRESLPKPMRSVGYKVTRFMDNHAEHSLVNAPELATFSSVRKDLLRLAAHIDGRAIVAAGQAPSTAHNDSLSAITKDWNDSHLLDPERCKSLKTWIERAITLADESNKAEQDRIDRLMDVMSLADDGQDALNLLKQRIPVFVLFSNYFRVKPLIHLQHLADRIDSKTLDDDQYDHGNNCLLQLLGFTARELSDLGKATEPKANQPDALQMYRDQLDRRMYQLNAASVKLTDEIRAVWKPSRTRPEAGRLRMVADGQYLKVVVDDDLGVEIEFDQRSEGFQWLVSFFVVFFAEAADKHKNAILLLDEPGLSLHALKQREFRDPVWH